MRAKMRRLFRDEANTVANLRHDNVVSIFDYGDHEGNPYLVMDYIEGRTLYQVIQAQEMLGRSRRLQLIEDLCAGLGYAHRHKLVHRDIKPANLIIDSSTGSLKILDFGVVRRIGSASTVGVPVGTFCYMSPEQTKGAATLDHRSDIFAVGLVFYELMSGRKAFPPGKSIGDLVARIQRDPPTAISELVPSIPKAIEDIISKSLEKQPEARYQDLAVMGREISRIRTRLEAAEQSERTVISVTADPTVAPVKPSQASVTELLESAEHAFETGDDHAAVEFCNRILTLKPAFPAALSLLARAEARRRDSRLREVLQQAEKLMGLEELTSAKATLGRARDIDPSSPRIRAVEEKLEAALSARAAELERAERERIEQMKPPPAAAPPPPPPSPIDLDPDGVTRPIPRDLMGRPPLPGSRTRLPASVPEPAPPPVTPPPPPAAPPAPPQDHGETMLLRSIGAPPKLQPPPVRPPSSVRPPAPTPPSSLLHDSVTDVSVPTPRSMLDSTDPAFPVAPRASQPTPVPPPPVTPTPPPPPPAPTPPPFHDASADAATRVIKPPSSIRRARRVVRPDELTEELQTPVAMPAIPAPIAPVAPVSPPPPVAAAPTPKTKPPAAPPPPATAGVVPVPAARSTNWLGLAIVGGLVAILIVAAVAIVLRTRPSDAPPAQPSQDVQATPPATPPTAAVTPPTTTPAPDPAKPPDATTATDPATPPAAATDPAAPAATATVTTLFVDVRPWARVKIVPATPDQAAPADALYAPFAVDLPPGTYTFECENGGVTRPLTFQVTVGAGPPQAVTRNMPGFNATKTVDGLLSQND